MPTGKVVLVGAGPGDPGLLTLKGKRLLEQAEVVVYDRLVTPALLELAPQAEKIDVGKQQSRHPIPQPEINRILVEQAKAGKLVVRLKGGDPYLFGRGGEEAEDLAESGIPFEVVPGVTSALSVLSYGGIPATHRDFSSSVHIVTGHARAGEALDIDFDALCRTGGTLVFLMAVTSMKTIVKGLLDAGMPPEMPAAIIENGTLPRQRSVGGALDKIAGKAQAAKIKSPAILAVGKVCGLGDTLDWYSSLPLFGRTIVVTRPKNRAGTLCRRLEERGAHVIPLPCIETKPVESEELVQALCRLRDYQWLVLTSPQGAQCLFQRMHALKMDARALAPVKIAAVGPGTAAELEKYGIRADYIPAQYDAVHLAQGLLRQMQPRERALLVRARQATPALPILLQENGIAFDDIAAYETRSVVQTDPALEKLLNSGGVDAVTFTSASTVAGFAACFPQLQGERVTAVCIGEASAAAAKEKGYRVIQSKNATIDDLVQAIQNEVTV